MPAVSSNTVPDKQAKTSSFTTLARLLISLLYLFSCVSKIQSFDKDTGGPAMATFAPKLDAFTRTLSKISGMHIAIDKAMYPQILLAYSASEFLGAALFASDIRFGAIILVSVTALISFVLHPFWDYEHQPAVLKNELDHFIKNIAIIGGLLYYLSTSPGTQYKNRFERMQDEAKARAVTRRQREAAGAEASVEKDKDE